jgi:hypothetical protein
MNVYRKTEFRLNAGLLIPNLGIASVEGILFFVFLLILPKDPKSNFFLGFSSRRLLLLAGLLIITILFLSSFFYFQHHKRKATSIDSWFLSEVNRIPILLIIYFFLWVVIYAFMEIFEPAVLSILVNPSSLLRLAPFWGLALLIPFQLMCFWFYEWKWRKLTFPSMLTLGAFIGFLVLGLCVYQQYGLAWDEPLQVSIGRTNLYYITTHDPYLLSFTDRYYGPAYEMILFLLTNSSDSRLMYLQRHLFNFLFFLGGVVAFNRLAQRLFGSSWMGFLASIFLMLSPRIFADSFYNSKDIPFLVVFIFAMLTLVLFLDNPTWLTAVLHAGVSAFLIAIRISGIFIPIISIVFLIARWIFQSKSGPFWRELFSICIYLVLTVSLTTLFYPIFWHDPLAEFINGINRMSHYPWIADVLYMGNLIKTDQLPWHYIPVWISISTPILYLVCFGLGVTLMVIGLFRRSANWYDSERRNHLIIITCFLCPLFVVIILHSVLYDAWRQMFFIYPAFLLISVQGIRLAIPLLQRWFRLNLVYSFVAISLVIGVIDPVSFAVRNHPFENIYFNRLAGDNMVQIKQRFELDYWGLSFKQGIDYILLADPSNRIPIYVTAPPGKEYVEYFLPDNQKKRLIVVDDPDQARYFIGNYRYHPEEYPFNKKIYSVNVDKASILSVFDLRVEPGNQSK